MTPLKTLISQELRSLSILSLLLLILILLLFSNGCVSPISLEWEPKVTIRAPSDTTQTVEPIPSVNLTEEYPI